MAECVGSLRLFDYLWQQDLHSSYRQFLSTDPRQQTCCEQVHRFRDIERAVRPPHPLPSMLHYTCICVAIYITSSSEQYW